ncbi:MAG: hypothetical protein KTU85_08160 [Acidimicrobiia bacterium]|nr:hypothetical protein [Acidimicrobiia bacterium]MCY4457203.1 hypothetical protein [Acidimicrobiaceae bacterium]
MRVVPVIDTRVDALSCDYPDGRYQCKMTTVSSGKTLRADHEIEGADELKKLLSKGFVMFALELVSTVSLISTLELAEEGKSTQTVVLDPSSVAEQGAQARPGLIAVRNCTLSGSGLSPAWQEFGGRIPVQAGQWLARGQHYELASPQTSLMKFVADKELRRREMRCRFAHPSYEIVMHPDDLAQCQQNEAQPAAKAVMLAAWVSALADANNRSAFGGHADGDVGEDGEQREPLGHQLAAKIKALDPACPTPGEEDYDPLRAATVLLGEDLITFDSEGVPP